VSGALTTATVVQTGKGQHRGAKQALKWNTVPNRAVPDVPCGSRDFCCPEAGKAPEQEKSGAERELQGDLEFVVCEVRARK
jgi:hypothetical protein